MLKSDVEKPEGLWEIEGFSGKIFKVSLNAVVILKALQIEGFLHKKNAI